MATNPFHHEDIYRNVSVRESFSDSKVVICGVGALGSNLVDNLTRLGFSNLRVIDFDRVEAHNISTQIYGKQDIGALKVDALKNRIYRTVDVELETFSKKLESTTTKKAFKDADLLVDCLDNTLSRQLIKDYALTNKKECLHLGLFEDYAEVIWNDKYEVPSRMGDDVCDYPLARNVIILCIAVASEVLVSYLLNDRSPLYKRNYSITLRDFSIKELR